jgi:transcriptional regulator with AAA-type ATPase domain
MKNLYITWHYTTHGVAYLKHILSKFYQLNELPKQINFDKLEQEKLNEVFEVQQKNGFLFDEVVYLTASQKAFDNLSTRRFSYKKTILEDELIMQLGLKDIFLEITKDENESICYDLKKEFSFIESKYPNRLIDFKKAVWRNIQHYPIKEQIYWLNEFSNFKNVYANNFKVVELGVNDLRDEKQIANEVSKWVKENLSSQHVQPIINVSLGSSETQVVWHILAESGQLPEITRFIKTYDDKSNEVEKRFKQFSIQEISTALISEISSDFKVYGETKSPKRELVNKKMQSFLKSGFSILLIGERGIGKSDIAKNAKSELTKLEKSFKGEIIEANCASFRDDSMAESELFGYKGGTFTGADKTDRQGIIKSAEKGILFLDEIHHLSKSVQAKLMKALQTNANNQLTIRKLGEVKEEKVDDVRMIFATNKSISDLRNDLLPDFYDRIVQHVIQIPPLRETTEDRLIDWSNVWRAMKFKGSADVPKEAKLIDWLNKLPLYGNYRDLQKIAIYYNGFNSFDETIRNMIDEKTPLEYAKKEFESYHYVNLPNSLRRDSTFIVSEGKNARHLEADFKYFLQEWAIKIYGSKKSAAEKLEVTVKALNDWKNIKMLK